MTAKAKAQELYDKYTAIENCANHPTALFDGQICKHQAKDCALIAAEEARQEALSYDMATGKNREQYWQEVKAEIEKL